MRLAVGPVLFGWSPARMQAFYEMVAAHDAVDIVYIGEVVCSKRMSSGVDAQLRRAERLKEVGKEVVLSTLAMPTTEAELKTIRDLAAVAGDMGIMIEANDVSAVAIASDMHLPFVAGPHLNVYSAGSLSHLRRLGARRVTMPLELPAKAIAGVIGNEDVEVEYFAHGRLPLTFSARCYTARAQGLSKRHCQHVCFRDDEGIAMRSLDGGGFATINGIQIMSERPYTVIDRLDALASQGVGVLRLSPQATCMEEVIRYFHGVLARDLDAKSALKSLAGGRAPNEVFCNGYFHGRQGRLWFD